MTIAHLRTAVDRAIDMALDDTVSDARRLSSGTRSSARLRQMDHPYARRHGTPLLPPEIINVQSGEFLSAWHRRRTSEGGQVINDSSVADFLKSGTPRMFARPIDIVLTTKLADHAEHRINSILKALNG